PAPILCHLDCIPPAYLRFPPQARKRKVPWYRAQHAEPAIPPAFTGRGPLAFHHEGEGLRPFRQKDGLCLCLVRHHTLVLILRLTMFNSARGGRAPASRRRGAAEPPQAASSVAVSPEQVEAPPNL